MDGWVKVLMDGCRYGWMGAGMVGWVKVWMDE